ncbi:oxidoreductase [Herminiimonas sp. KBW02]|uniref:PDR/VanB family oxidoreductase n=1 Tax=Herminiimonas sp. KBW02 TaxID=2153363 RepID=UPI000F5A5A22|nr:PDR/VanB family oxidoreductase [Herminiimonas sp. KBW02]RQO36413.1 oxidoreductase [Herminiimonas sp. KBW02]
MTNLSVRVNKITQEACDIKSFELLSASGEALPAFAPGAHIDVRLGEGVIRQYSLCNGPDETDRYLIAVKKETASRGGSLAMHERIREGDLITISSPRNHFPLEQSGGPYLLLAAGIGVTPILAMARHLLAADARFELHYFTRSIAHTAFQALLSGAGFAGHVQFHYGLEPDGLRAYLEQLLSVYPKNSALYLCGPRVFMDLVESAAAASWPPEAVHLEYFNAEPQSRDAEHVSFEVRLERSGGTYLIPPDMTIVEVLAQHGIHIETSCEQGVCGTCLTAVLEGIPDHKDVYLTAAEKKSCDKIMPCVSRAKSGLLVLDL